MKQYILLFATAFLMINTANANSAIAELKLSDKGFYKNYQTVFGAFNAHRQQSGVALAWNTTLDNDIVSFSIERSYDGSNFSVIANVAPSLNAWQRFKDDAVFPGYIYYKIAAHMTDGTIQYSSVEMVRLVSKK